MKTVINIIVTVVMSVMAVLGATLTASASTTTTNVVGVTVNISPSSAGATANWQIMFTPSTGSALTASASTVTLTTNATMSFPTVQSDYSVNGVPVTGGITNIKSGVIITMPVNVALYNTATITVDGVVNPGSGSYSLGVATSATANPSPSTVSFTINPGAPAICPSSAANSTMPQCAGVPPITPYDGNVNGGTWVQITGANFANATEVLFGQSNPGTNLEIISNTTIGVTSPPEAQSDCIPGAATSGTGYSCVVNIQVVTPSGTSAVVSSDEFTYTNSPNCLSVQSVSPAYGPTTSTGFSETGGNTYVPGSGYAAKTGTTTVQGSVQVVISGNLFDANNLTATAVSFAPATGSSIPAPWFKVINNTTIDAVAPVNTSPQTMNVEITVPVASSSSETSYETSPATYADQFTYYTTPPAGPTITNVTPSSGTQLGGTIVKIMGTNFAQVESVSFGGVGTETFDVISPSEITAPSPTYSCGANTVGSCVVNVQVLTVNGVTQVTAADEFTYMGLPTIAGPGNTDGVNPSCGPVTGGTPVTISGNNLQGVTTVQFGTAGSATDVTYVAGSGGTEVTATSPPVSLNGAPSLTENVTVTGTMGTSPLSSTATFTYPCAQLPTVTEVIPNSGPQYKPTTVRIVGTNLQNATTVQFGGAGDATNVTYVSGSKGTEVTATTPICPSSACPSTNTMGTKVNVTVTTPIGTSVADPPADYFTYFSASSSVACETVVDNIAPGSSSFPGGIPATIDLSATVFSSVKGVTPSQCITDTSTISWGSDSLSSTSGSYSCSVITSSTTSATGQCNITSIPTGQTAGCATNGSAECQIMVQTTTVIPTYSPASSTPWTFYYTVSGQYNAITPERVCDTRSGYNDVASGVTGQCANSGNPVITNQSVIAQVAGIGAIPANAEAVIATVTVAPVSNGGSGYISVNPGSTTYSSTDPPSTSLLNFGKEETTSNTGTFLLSTGGQLSLFTSAEVNVIVDISGYYAPSSQSYYSPMAPQRICDTRKLSPSDLSFDTTTAQCNNSGIPLSSSSPIPVAVDYVGGPISAMFANATAVSLVVGVIGTVGPVCHKVSTQTVCSTVGGYITVYPATSAGTCGPVPMVSNVNYKDKAPQSNAVTVEMSSSGTDGTFCVANNNSEDPVNIYIDLQGYFTSSANGAASYTPLTPVRICDTRSTYNDVVQGASSRCANSGNSLSSNSPTITVSVPAAADVPSNATAIVVNVVIVGATGGGYATVYNGGTQPGTSNLNWGAASNYKFDQIPDISNMVVIPITQSTSSFKIFASSSANVVVDVYGYYSPTS